ncbi:hypothetical protein KL941_001602 [Ogataea angusta]|nr:hypothetical protein KL941_001602 [Ogataea angusta]
MPISLPTDERPSASRTSLQLPGALRKLFTARVRNVPVSNLLILVLFAYFLAKLTTRYHQLYTKSSLVATMATNIVLYGIADTLAQSITAYCQQASFQERNLPYNIATYLETLVPRRPEDYFVDYGEDGEISVQQVGNTTEAAPPTFQVRRFAGFVFWGFLMSFVQVVWYSFLNAMYKDVPTFVSVLERCRRREGEAVQGVSVDAGVQLLSVVSRAVCELPGDAEKLPGAVQQRHRRAVELFSVPEECHQLSTNFFAAPPHAAFFRAPPAR